MFGMGMKNIDASGGLLFKASRQLKQKNGIFTMKREICKQESYNNFLKNCYQTVQKCIE